MSASGRNIESIDNKEFSLLFNMSPSPLILTSLSGDIQKANGAAHLLFGYDSGALLSAHLKDIFPDSNISVIFEASQPTRIDTESTDKIKAVLPLELVGRSQQGHPIEVELAFESVKSNNGSFIIISIRDISNQKKFEADLSRAKQDAVNANKAKSEFIANMSHELRTPLNATLGTVNLLQNTQLSNLQLSYLRMIQDSGESLLAILNDILDISKIESGRMELSPTDFNLDNLLVYIGSIMAVNTGDKKIDLSINVEEKMHANFYGDPLRIQQILINLVSNAIKFTDEGFVVLTVKCISEEEDHVVLEFSIQDTGIGISEKNKRHLFKAFSQADNSITRMHGGTGLGLLISKRFVEMMGGMIRFDSIEGVGSTFTFTASLIKSLDTSTEFQFQKKLTVLLAENSPTISQSILSIIKHWDWPCTHVDSEEAAQSAISCNQNYDLILLGESFSTLDRSTLIHNTCTPKLDKTTIIYIARGRKKELLTELVAQKRIDGTINQPITRANLYHTVHQAMSKKTGPNVSAQTPFIRQTKQLSGMTILLVEDNEMNQVVAKGLLEQFGASIEIACNGKAAIDILESSPNKFDTILMDVQMPVMDGFTATRIIQKDLKLTIPIIAMTAGVMLSEKNKCTQAGMTDFIAKPIQTKVMINTILRCNNKQEHFDITATITARPPTKHTPAEHGIFEPERLLKYVRGNSQRYNTIIQMIENIVQLGKQPLNDGINLYLSGEHDEARRLFHTLKGSMGNIGAQAVWRSAQHVEHALSEHLEKSIIDKKMAELDVDFEEMLLEAKSWLKHHSSETSKASAREINKDPVNTLPQAQLTEQLSTLCFLLSENNMQAFDAFEKVKGPLSQLLEQNSLKEVEKHVQSLNFQSALTFIKPLLRQNNI